MPEAAVAGTRTVTARDVQVGAVVANRDGVMVAVVVRKARAAGGAAVVIDLDFGGPYGPCREFFEPGDWLRVKD